MSKHLLVVERGHFTAPSATTIDREHNVRIVHGKKPWFEIPHWDESWRGHPTIYIPVRGFQDQQWCDGPIVHWDKNGLIVNWVDVGLPVRLTLDCDEPGNPAFVARNPNWQAAKQTLAAAMMHRQRATDARAETDFYIEGLQHDVKDALLLVALRFAVRDGFLRADAMPEEEKAPAWRRLLQNLGIYYGRAPQRKESASHLNLQEFRALIPDALLLSLADSCNASGHVIPPKLISP